MLPCHVQHHAKSHKSSDLTRGNHSDPFRTAMDRCRQYPDSIPPGALQLPPQKDAAWPGGWPAHKVLLKPHVMSTSPTSKAFPNELKHVETWETKVLTKVYKGALYSNHSNKPLKNDWVNPLSLRIEAPLPPALTILKRIVHGRCKHWVHHDLNDRQWTPLNMFLCGKCSIWSYHDPTNLSHLLAIWAPNHLDSTFHDIAHSPNVSKCIGSIER